jgi:hypothetical protein
VCDELRGTAGETTPVLDERGLSRHEQPAHFVKELHAVGRLRGEAASIRVEVAHVRLPPIYQYIKLVVVIKVPLAGVEPATSGYVALFRNGRFCRECGKGPRGYPPFRCWLRPHRFYQIKVQGRLFSNYYLTPKVYVKTPANSCSATLHVVETVRASAQDFLGVHLVVAEIVVKVLFPFPVRALRLELFLPLVTTVGTIYESEVRHRASLVQLEVKFEYTVGLVHCLGVEQAGSLVLCKVETVGEVLAPALSAVTAPPPVPYPSISVEVNTRHREWSPDTSN